MGLAEGRALCEVGRERKNGGDVKTESERDKGEEQRYIYMCVWCKSVCVMFCGSDYRI